MERIKNFLPNILLSIVLTLSIFLPDLLFSYLNSNYSFNIELKDLIAITILMIFVSFFNKISINITFILFLILIFLELSNFNFFGSLIDPHAIILLFLESDEIYETLNETTLIFINPLLSILPSLIMLFIINKINYFNNSCKSKLKYIFILFLIFLPLKASLSITAERFMPKLDSFSLRNIIFSSSYFLGKDLWDNLFIEKEHKKFLPYKVSKIDSPKNRTVVLIMGESLNYKHMSLYGYEKNTTPYLSTLRKDKDFVYHKAISSAVYTKVSLPMFFNIQREPENLAHSIGQSTNLFNLAKKNGFDTFFYSKQKLKLVTNSLSMYNIDKFKSSINYPSESLDDELINEIDNIDFNKNNFVVLHQRSAHTPYEYNYPKEYERFKFEKNNYHEYMNNSYDNSVLFTDSILYKIISKLKTKKDENHEIILFFTPDHGEMLGENGKYGHSKLDINCALIPFIYYQVNSNFIDNIKQKNFYTHFDISKLIALSFGYDIVNPNEDEYIYVNGTGNMGEAGFLKYSNQDIIRILKN